MEKLIYPSPKKIFGTGGDVLVALPLLLLCVPDVLDSINKISCNISTALLAVSCE